MKVTLQSLLKSLLSYGFFLIVYMFLVIGCAIRVAGPSQISATQFLSQFWHSYRWLMIVPHVLYVLVFIAMQGRINQLNNQPPSVHDETQIQEQHHKADTLLRWVAGPAFLFSIAGLMGLAFFFLKLRFSIAFPIALFLLYVLLAANGLNILAQNYLHYLRKWLAKTVEEVIAENKRTILYLRSFRDDEVAAGKESALLTEEEQLSKAFEPIGPMIATGRPGEALPEVGAARAYFTDDQWQAAVQHYMNISCLVVLRAGLSQGLIWEIQNSIRRLDPGKFILLIPFEKDAYDQFRERVQSLFPKPLPDHSGHNAHRAPEAQHGMGRKYCSLLGLIYFDSDWTADFEKISAENVPHEYEMIGSPYAAEMTYLMMHYALRPIHARLGITWDDLGLRWRTHPLQLSL